jgi:hypothetical protein
MTRGLLRFSIALVALLCSAPELQAQEIAPPPPSVLPPLPLPSSPPDPRAGVELTGNDPRLRFEIYSLAKGAKRDVPIHACANPCRVLLERGEYRVRVSGGQQQITADRKIEVTGDGSWRFSLPDRKGRSSALALAITGTALLPVGLIVAFVSASSVTACGHGCDGTDRPNEAASTGVVVGLGMMVVGAVLTPIGWVQFARNRKPKMEEPRQAARTKAEPRIGLGAAPVPGGAAAALWGRF